MPRLNLSPSSNVAAADYLPEAQVLIVTFHNGRSYSYQGVDQATAEAFEGADSPGRFLNTHLRGRFSSQRA